MGRAGNGSGADILNIRTFSQCCTSVGSFFPEKQIWGMAGAYTGS